jgi:hypothetical protein
MLSKILYRAAVVAALILTCSCGVGDDDGQRLGEYIVGTWLRGWGEGDVIMRVTQTLNQRISPTTGLSSCLMANTTV